MYRHITTSAQSAQLANFFTFVFIFWFWFLVTLLSLNSPDLFPLLLRQVLAGLQLTHRHVEARRALSMAKLATFPFGMPAFSASVPLIRQNRPLTSSRWSFVFIVLTPCARRG